MHGQENSKYTKRLELEVCPQDQGPGRASMPWRLKYRQQEAEDRREVGVKATGSLSSHRQAMLLLRVARKNHQLPWRGG